MAGTASSSEYTFDIDGRSDTGRRRRRNEDFWGSWQDVDVINDVLIQRLGQLYLVSDGVGGNEDGDIASREATQDVMRLFYSTAYAVGLTPAQRLERAILDASKNLAQQISELDNNMAATLVAALVVGDQLIIANVGDSRAYVIRETGRIEQLSIDHVQNGNELTQAMGDTQLDVAMCETSFTPGDMVILCTDGLYDLVKDTEIARIVRQQSAHSATRHLINLANRRAGHDNITVLIIRNGVIQRSIPIGLYTRMMGVVAAAIVGLFIAISSLESFAPVQSNQVRSFLGIRREPTAALGPTATLSPSQVRPTSTPVPTQAPPTPQQVAVPTLPPPAPAEVIVPSVPNNEANPPETVDPENSDPSPDQSDPGLTNDTPLPEQQLSPTSISTPLPQATEAPLPPDQQAPTATPLADPTEAPVPEAPPAEAPPPDPELPTTEAPPPDPELPTTEAPPPDPAVPATEVPVPEPPPIPTEAPMPEPAAPATEVPVPEPPPMPTEAPMPDPAAPTIIRLPSSPEPLPNP